MARKKNEAPDLEKQLRDAIQKSGLTPTQLAERAGVALPQITRFINHDRGLSLKTAGKIVAALHLHLAPTGEKSPRKEGEV